MLSCVWFVKLRHPWETSVLGAVASGLRDKFDIEPIIYTESGTEGLEKLKAFSWISLSPVEKFFVIAAKGKLWHLWSVSDDAPNWWGVIRARARTVHTKLENEGEWRGHPSLFSYALSHGGETVIPPGFESMVDNSKNPQNKWLVNTDEISLQRGDMSDALNAAYASLNGARVTAPGTAVMDEMLGSDGYTKIPVIEMGSENANLAERQAATGQTAVPGAARRHIHENFTIEGSARKLAQLYRKMLGVNE